MYTVSKGPSKFVAKTRIGVPSHVDGSRDVNKRGSDFGNHNEGPNVVTDMSKPVFLQIKNRKQNHYRPQAVITPEHEEIVKFVSDHWSSVAQKSNDSSLKKNGRSAVYYKVSETNNQLKDFVPFDLDSWWEETPVESHRGRKRRPKFKKEVSVDLKKNAAVLVQKLREKSKAKSNQNKVEVNVQRLLKLSKNNIAHTNKEKKLLRKISKSKKECPKSQKKKQQPGATFTEEDFAEFEKEFFAN